MIRLDKIAKSEGLECELCELYDSWYCLGVCYQCRGRRVVMEGEGGEVKEMEGNEREQAMRGEV